MLCVLTSMYTIMIFMFGKLDLAIHNYRSITILGLLYGSMSLVAKTIKQDEENKPELIEPEAGHLQSDTEFVRNIQDMGFGRAESARR